MDSSSCDELPSPTSLKSLVCEVKYPYGNYLIHQLVLNNSKPSDSCRESDIRAALRSYPAAQVNKKNEDGFTALHLAVIKRNSFMVKMLLSCLPTLDVHAKCLDKAYEGTALHLAIYTKKYIDIPYLNAGNNYGKTRLDKDVNEDCLEIVKVLVERGASVNECDRDGDRPLHDAARCNQIEILELLMSKGAALNSKNNSGNTPLYKAVIYRRFEIVKVLLESGASVNERDKKGVTPLHFAAQRDRIDVLELLISRGAALNAEDFMGRTPLHEAAMDGSLEAVKVLVERGAAVDKEGYTALKIAKAENHIEIVAYLNCRFANVNAVGRDDGVLVPEKVCTRNQNLKEISGEENRKCEDEDEDDDEDEEEEVGLSYQQNSIDEESYEESEYELIDSDDDTDEDGSNDDIDDDTDEDGSDDDIYDDTDEDGSDNDIDDDTDEDGMDSSSCDELPSPTSLKSLVCEVKYPYGNYLIHQLVLNNSKPSDSCRESDIRAALRSYPAAQVNKKNKDGFTALHLAVIKRNSFMVKMLLSCLPTLDVHAKCLDQAYEGTALHLAIYTKKYIDIPYLNAGNNYGKTRLDKDVNEDCLEIVKVLVERGASVNECDRDGDTPLHDAARCNQIEILELLISKGAALNSKNNSGNTPLYKAVIYRRFEIVKVLLESGAFVNERDNKGETPLHLAAQRDRIDVLELLISRGAALNAADRLGRTPLHEAAWYGNLEAVKVLVESGASVNECNKCGITPLHVAARCNRIEILKLLISKGAALNAGDFMGRTPLHEAAMDGSLEAVKVLVERGAAVDKEGYTALKLAKARNHIEIVAYLNCRFANVNAVGRDDRVLVPERVCRNTEKLGEPSFKKMRRS